MTICLSLVDHEGDSPFDMEFLPKYVNFEVEYDTVQSCIPRSAYHCRRCRKAEMSCLIVSAIPSRRTTLSIGLFCRGKPKGFHSIPQGVCITSFPSCCLMAMSRASAKSSGKSPRSRDRVVRVTVSQGIPDIRC